jgi:hypothetical protein
LGGKRSALGEVDGSGIEAERVGEMGSILGVDIALLGVVASLTAVDHPAAD